MSKLLTCILLESIPVLESSLEEIQHLLMLGKREDAVFSALSSKNYALALLVATMCDHGTYQEAARRFAEDSFCKDSPLHTLAMLFSGQLQPPKDDILDRSGSSSYFGQIDQLIYSTPGVIIWPRS